MGTAWKVVVATTVVGWWIPPLLTVVILPMIISFLGFDMSEKLRQLEIHTMVDLQKALRVVDQERMVQRGETERVESDMAALHTMAAMLRHSREETEDILDAHQDIELYRNRWPQRLYGAAAVCIASCVGIFSMDKLAVLYGAAATCFVRWTRKIIAMGRSEGVLPVTTSTTVTSSAAASEEPIPEATGAGAVPVTTGVVTSDEPPAPVTTPPASSGSWLSFLGIFSMDQVSDRSQFGAWLGKLKLDDKLAGLYGAAATCKTSFVRWTRKIIALRRSDGVLPVTISTTVTPSHEPVQVTSSAAASEEPIPAATDDAEAFPVTTGAVTSDEPPAPVTTPPASSGSWLDNKLAGLYGAAATCKPSFLRWTRKIIPLGRSWLSFLCIFFDFIKNWFGVAVEFVCFLLYWPYEVLGYKEKDSFLDYVLTVIPRFKLKKRMDKVEMNVANVKKSSLVDLESKNILNDMTSKDKSKIRTDIKLKVFGRKELRDNIMDKLRGVPHGDEPSSSTSRCYSVIGIYGVAGSGKTTFARYTHDYIKDECKEKLFDVIMCIHVSRTFSVDDIFREMLWDITKGQQSNISDHKVLKDKLEESLRGKRFFLILDDLCVKDKNDKQLQELLAPLNVGMRGSKILVTAQTKGAARALCDDEPIKMPDLDGDQYFSMFMHYALGDSNVANEKEFISVGREISDKLHRSPIAAAMVAGRLGANLDISFWENTATLDMVSDTTGALWWSYQELNPDIRRCFEYCNIFPRRLKLEKDDLVRLWIAQGFVKTRSEKYDMEDVAEAHIHELVSRSFLQPEAEGRFFTIHDTVRDLIVKVAGSDYFIIENARSQREEDWKVNVSEDVRHLYVQNFDEKLINEKILGLENLRTLIFNVVETDTPIVEKAIESMCKRVPKLRVFAFTSVPKHHADATKQANNFSIPKAICQLKHLRYLCFRTRYPCMVILPSTLSKLHRIQLLHFGFATILEFTFVDLINLRHLICGYMEFPNMGRRTSLQTIPDFIIRNEQGYELKQLRDLNKLRGILEIRGLEKVNSEKEALEANLSAKKRLTILALSWLSRDCSREVQTEVLEGLCPPVRLERLEIEYYNGLQYPDWMVGEQSGGPKNLQQLRLWECLRPSELAQSFPHLRVLELWFCSWNDLPDDMDRLTSLKKLVIVRCLNIQSLPTLPLSLEEFSLEDCDAKFMKSCQTKDHSYWEMIRYIPRKVFDPPISEEDYNDEESDDSW